MGTFSCLCNMYAQRLLYHIYTALYQVLALHIDPNGPLMFTYLQETTEGVNSSAIKILRLVPSSRFCQLPFIALLDTIDGSWLNRLFTLFITASFLEI